MKTRTFLLAALALALLPVSARQSLPDSSTPAWIQEFNNLPETTRKKQTIFWKLSKQDTMCFPTSLWPLTRRISAY